MGGSEPMQYNGYDFNELSIPEMRQGIEQRIKQYEANIFDAMMNQKAEAATRNPRKAQAIAELDRQIDDIKSAIEAMSYELEMLNAAERAEKTTDDEEAVPTPS